MVKANHLVKKFGESTAVHDLSLNIGGQQTFGLLGPNGAGKSTFIGMMYGAVQRTSGDIRVFDLDPRVHSQIIKKRLGVVTQENALDESLTVLENMMVYAAFAQVPRDQRTKRIENLLEYMNLAHKRNSLIQTLSGGMKRRLVFVRALLSEPELLILDEPTTGLDPAVRHLLWNKVRELCKMGTTVILTTHYMHEAEVLCDQLVIMSGGRVVAEGSPQDLIRRYTPGYVGLFDLSELEKIKTLVAGKKDFFLKTESSGLSLRAPQLTDITQLHLAGELRPLQIRPANLEDVFLQLTGQEIQVDA